MLLDHLARAGDVQELSKSLAIIRNLIVGEAECVQVMKNCGGQLHLEHWLEAMGEEACPALLQPHVAELLMLISP